VYEGGYGSLTPHRESDNTFNGGEGGTIPINLLIENEEENNTVEENEVVEGPKIFKNDGQVLDAMANGDISSTDIIRIEYDDSDPNKPEGEIYEGTVKMGTDTNDDEYVQFLDGTHTNNQGDTNTHEGGKIVSGPESESESPVTEEEVVDLEKIESDFKNNGTKPTYEEYKKAWEIKNPNIPVPSEDDFNNMFRSEEEFEKIKQQQLDKEESEKEDPLRAEIEDTSEITTESTEEVVEETPERKTKLTEAEQDILDNYSIDGTVGEGKAEIKNSEGETIAYLEGNKLLGKKDFGVFGEKTFEIGEYVDNGDGTYTFKEGKDYNTVMSAASSEEKKVIETFKKAAEDNPQFARDIINTTEGNETNMSGSDIRTSATTFTPSSEDDSEVDVTEENLEDLEIEEEFAEPANINDDKETIRNRLLSEDPELANNTERLDELVDDEYENNQWELDEIEELKENKKYIDKIFADNPEIAEKYEGVPIEEYSSIDGFYEEVYEKIDEEIEVEEENQRQVNKEETGIFETDKQRAKRESDIAIYNELEAKKLDGTITPEEELQMEEIEDDNGGWNPNELYEINKTEQEEKDLNESEGKGAISNAELEQQEIEAEDLEAEREENFKLYGKRETDEEKYTRIENEKDENEEKGLGRLTNVQVEDQNVIFSTPNSEKALRNELKTKLKNKENALKAAESEEEKLQIQKDIETTNLALEYLELKKEHGNKNDVFDINTFREAVENNDNQQISMYYNDQRGEIINKLETQRKSIVDGTFEGTELEKQKILSTLETLNKSTQKSELPEFDSEYDKLLYMTNATNEDIDKLKALEKDKKFIEENGKVNTQILNVAAGDVANSGLTDTDMSTNRDYIAIINPKDGSTQYVNKDWVNSFDDNGAEIDRLEKKLSEGSITEEEKVTLKNYKANRFHSRDVMKASDIYMNTSGHPSGVTHTYRGGTDEVDAFLLNRKKKIFETGANPDINLTPEQIALFDNIKSEDYDMSNLETDLDQIVAYNPEAFDFDTTLETTPDVEPRSLGPTGQEILQGTIDVATGIMDSFGGPDALINAVMGKKALSAAMKDITPMQQAKLSPMFHAHLRDTKELSKRGYHPSEELKIRRGIDTAYQQGLENTVRGTAGDRAKFLASSGIFDAKRSLALLEVASQDAALQRENKKAYSELLTYKENFDATQQEAKRTENLQMQLANKKAASEFAGLTFANALSGMGGSSSLYNKLKESFMNDYRNNGNFQLTSPFENNNTTTDNNTTIETEE